MNIMDLMITSLDTITGYSLTDDPLFVLDELQDATISNTEEKVDLTGKQGRRLGSLKRNKGVSISGTNGMLSGGLMEAQVGSSFEEKTSTTVSVVEYLIVDSDKTATLSHKAIGTAGSEISAVWVKNSTGLASKKLTQSTATTTAGTFTYTASTKKFAFHTGDVDAGDEIVVFYERNIPGAVLKNDSDKYSVKARLVVDGTAEDKCGTVYHIQFTIPKADFSGEFEFALGGDQATHAFSAESLAGACGAAGNLWNYTVFGVNAEDAA